MLSFVNYILGLLPRYFIEKDSYKDANGKGLLQRYVSIFEDELDADFITFITELSQIKNVYTTDEKFLSYLGNLMGDPPDPTNNDPDLFRAFLASIINIYKVKGTIRSYELLFYWLGVYVDTVIRINIEEEQDDRVIYDSDLLYDDDLNYDTLCAGCLDYWIKFYKHDAECLDGTPVDMGVDFGYLSIDDVKRMVGFIEPIDAKLKGIIGTVLVCDDLVEINREELNITVYELAVYDDGWTYDDLLSYDEDSIIQTYNLVDFT